MVRYPAFFFASMAVFACAEGEAPLSANGASPPGEKSATSSPAGQFFFDELSSLCGEAYEGKLASDDPEETDFAGRPLIMHVSACTDDQINAHFFIGEDRSRTWVISRHAQGLHLRHDHRERSGEPAEITDYGGWSQRAGPYRLDFPADEKTRALLARHGLTASLENVWSLEIYPGRLFAYELNRPNRHFRVVFDLSHTVETPPPAWGAASG